MIEQVISRRFFSVFNKNLCGKLILLKFKNKFNFFNKTMVFKVQRTLHIQALQFSPSPIIRLLQKVWTNNAQYSLREADPPPNRFATAISNPMNGSRLAFHFRPPTTKVLRIGRGSNLLFAATTRRQVQSATARARKAAFRGGEWQMKKKKRKKREREWNRWHQAGLCRRERLPLENTLPNFAWHIFRGAATVLLFRAAGLFSLAARAFVQPAPWMQFRVNELRAERRMLPSAPGYSF